MPHNSIQPLYDLVRLNTILNLEAMDEFDEENANERILGGSRNSFKFVMGHMIWARCFMSKIIGEPEDSRGSISSATVSRRRMAPTILRCPKSPPPTSGSQTRWNES